MTESFLGFAVSESPSEETCAKYSTLRSIYDRNWPRNALIIVAVFSEASRKTMTAIAEDAGFASILPADAYLLRVLEEHYAKGLCNRTII